MTWASQLGKYGIQAGGGVGPYIVEFMIVAGGGGAMPGYYTGGGRWVLIS